MQEIDTGSYILQKDQGPVKMVLGSLINKKKLKKNWRKLKIHYDLLLDIASCETCCSWLLFTPPSKWKEKQRFYDDLMQDKSE